MSLRELPPEQQITGPRWRRLRMVPLIALAIAGVLAAGVGIVTEQRHPAGGPGSTPAPVVPAPSASASASASASGALPESCHPAVTPPAQQPWSAGQAAASELVWSSHAADMTQAYVVGSDGWVDWGDIMAANLSQAIGRRLLSVDEVARWHAYLSEVQTHLSAEKIPFYVVVAPAKWGAFPEKLPAWAQSIRGSGPLDQLLADAPDLPIIDLRSTLHAAASEHPTYSSVNSHWTDYGAYVAWKQIAACLRTTAPQLGDVTVPAIDGVSTSDSNNEFANYGITAPTPDWTSPDFSAPLHPVTLVTPQGTVVSQDGTLRTQFSQMPASSATVDAQTDSSALVISDSFAVSLSVEIHQSFARTWQVRHNFDTTAITVAQIDALVAQDHPDVVILEIAQRHLNFPPPAQ